MVPNYVEKAIDIVFYIINKKKTSLMELSSELSISKRTVKEHIARINKNFNEDFSLPNFITSSNSGNITVNTKYKADAVQHAYKLKLHLLKKIIPFNYTVMLVTNSRVKKAEIIKALFISTQYLTKVTQQLNLYLSNFGIKICRDGDF